MADAVRVLGGLRLLVGVGTWLTPAGSTRVFGLTGAAGLPTGTVVGRLFGVRETALALGALSPDPAVRTAALRAGVACDALDAVAVLLSLRGLPRAAVPLTGCGALAFLGLGLRGLRS